MERYDIKKLYIDTRADHSWQKDVSMSMNNLVVVQAPEKTGKTYLCRDDVRVTLCAGAEGENILYYSPEEGDAARMAFGLQILLDRADMVCQKTRSDIYLLENDSRDTALYAPTSVVSMARLLASGEKFSKIIIDNAESVGYTILHTALLKSCVDNADFLAIGSFRFEDETFEHKDLWKWLLNSPSADTFVVQYGGIKEKIDEDGDLDGLSSRIHDAIFGSLEHLQIA